MTPSAERVRQRVSVLALVLVAAGEAAVAVVAAATGSKLRRSSLKSSCLAN